MILESLCTEAELAEGLLCKAFSRHTWEGYVWERSNPGDGLLEWVEDFTCTFCSTKRTSLLEPDTCVVLGSRQYRYTSFYNKTMSFSDANKELITRLYQKATNGHKAYQ